MNPEQRIEELEIKLAHLERGMQEVSDEVARQQQLIERLTERGHQLMQRVEAMQSEGGEDAATRIELPPHY
jgi:SlyX protein